MVLPLKDGPLLEQQMGLPLLQGLGLFQACHLSRCLPVKPVELSGCCPHSIQLLPQSCAALLVYLILLCAPNSMVSSASSAQYSQGITKHARLGCVASLAFSSSLRAALCWLYISSSCALQTARSVQYGQGITEQHQTDSERHGLFVSFPLSMPDCVMLSPLHPAAPLQCLQTS